MKRMLVIDTETGGFDPAQNAIITLGAVIFNDGPEATFHEMIYDPTGYLDPEALEVNGYTEEEIGRFGLGPLAAVTRFEQFLLKNEMYGKITLAGHNLAFDVGFLKRLYWLAGMTYEDRFHYGGLCTKSAALVFEAAGRISPASSSLVDVAPAMGVAPLKAHNALADALMAAKVLKRMIDSIRV
jgi:DNA polymerase III epsilon subunit-like protein